MIGRLMKKLPGTEAIKEIVQGICGVICISITIYVMFAIDYTVI